MRRSHVDTGVNSHYTDCKSSSIDNIVDIERPKMFEKIHDFVRAAYTCQQDKGRETA